MKKFIKRNIKIILGFTLGLIWSSGIAYAATILFDSDEVSYDNTTSGLSATNVQSALDELYIESTSYQLFEARVSTLESQIYPVGSVYISTTKTTASQVASLFGGTWEAFGTGRTLVGVNTSDTSFDTVEETGGAKTVNLSHSHTVNSHSHTMAHTHKQTSNFTIGHVLGNGYYYAEGVTVANNAQISTGGSSAARTGSESPDTDSKLSSSQSILPPYITVYMYKRTA